MARTKDLPRKTTFGRWTRKAPTRKATAAKKIPSKVVKKSNTNTKVSSEVSPQTGEPKSKPKPKPKPKRVSNRILGKVTEKCSSDPDGTSQLYLVSKDATVDMKQHCDDVDELVKQNNNDAYDHDGDDAGRGKGSCDGDDDNHDGMAGMDDEVPKSIVISSDEGEK